MIKQIFPDFYFLKKINNHDLLKNQFMQIAKNECLYEPDWRGKVLTTKTQNHQINYEPFFIELNCIIKSMCEEFKLIKNVHYKIESIWMNLYNQGCWQEIHHHSNPVVNFSFVYFLQFDDKKDAKFYFFNEKSKNYSSSGLNRVFELYQKNHWPDIFIPKIQEGDVLLFPAHLTHGVEIQNYETDRCTISGNIYIHPV